MIRKSRSTNAHVTVTAFRAGEVTPVKAAKGRTEHGWAPLYLPDGARTSRPVFAFLFDIKDQDEAAARLRHAELTGILATDGLPRNARQALETVYPGIDLSDAIYLHVGAAWPSLRWNLALLLIGVLLIVGGGAALCRRVYMEHTAQRSPK